MSIKLLALDLDGTIFGDDLVISERTRRAILHAQQQGVLVTIATGRMFVSAKQIATDLSIDAPLICYQGAMVRHSGTGETLYHKTVPRPLAHEIIAKSQQFGLHLNLYLDDAIYAAQITPEALFYSRINMGLHINEVGNLGTWLDRQDEAKPTKLVIITDANRTDEVLELFTSLYGDKLQVTKSHPRFTEFTSIECSKGRALAFLSHYVGINRDDVMAIGDGHNDLDMIAWAGHGVAMASAPQAVQDAARSLCAALIDDGTAQTIEKYVLNMLPDTRG
ncbi:MAG: Cof-type HAD-IIB family hydrolase [Chloroflexia bacterium]